LAPPSCPAAAPSVACVAGRGDGELGQLLDDVERAAVGAPEGGRAGLVGVRHERRARGAGHGDGEHVERRVAVGVAGAGVGELGQGTSPEFTSPCTGSSTSSAMSSACLPDGGTCSLAYAVAVKG